LKGIILACGNGTRLCPMKLLKLLQVYDEPTIHCPLTPLAIVRIRTF
jgi:dTDP-glucose pyrophosphorylase